MQYCVSGCGVVEFDFPTTVLQKREGKGLEFEFEPQLQNFLNLDWSWSEFFIFDFSLS